jgi:hypothetical protein
MSARRLPPLLLPLYIGAVALIVVAVACAASGRSVVKAATTTYADAGLYMDIAEHGSSAYRCSPTDNEWCGNAAWLPGFPGVIRAVSIVTRLRISAAGALVAVAFTIATLVLLWATFLHRRTDVAATLALLYAAFAPGQMFGYMTYPLSMLAFLTILYLWLVVRGHWVWAGALAFAVVITYPVGICAPLAVALWLLFDRATPIRERGRRILLAAAPAALALGALAVWFQAWTGHWNATFLIGAKYRNDPQSPLGPIFHAVGVLFGELSTFHKARAATTLLAAVVVLSVVITVIVRRRTLGRAETLLAVWALCAWVAGLATARVSRERTEFVLLPVAALLPVLPRRLLFAITILAVILVVPMEILFLRGEVG